MTLKGKTTWSRSKPNQVARDFVKVPMELLKLHKEVFGQYCQVHEDDILEKNFFGKVWT